MDVLFSNALQGWGNFYFMMGGASAGLMGLMFVALSLGTHLVNDETLSSFPTFVTPNIIYFVSVLLIAALMLVPDSTAVGTGLFLLGGGALGLIRASRLARRLIRMNNEQQIFNRWQRLWLIISPITGYILIPIAGLGFLGGQWALAFLGIWLASVLLMLCAIANTWSLMLWIIEQGKR
ncbi:MAG: hypothetical protein JNM70_09335 [Anaerolineae bacterium]|nr:hypothetical protein [Anaerolineae bacterium]